MFSVALSFVVLSYARPYFEVTHADTVCDQFVTHSAKALCYFRTWFWIITNVELPRLAAATIVKVAGHNVANRWVPIPASRQDKQPEVKLDCTEVDIRPRGHSGRMGKPPQFITFRCHPKTQSWSLERFLRTQIYQELLCFTKRVCAFQKLKSNVRSMSQTVDG